MSGKHLNGYVLMMRTSAPKHKPNHQTKSASSRAQERGFSAQDRAVSSIFHLQRTIGNQAVQRLLQANPEGLEVESVATATARFAHDFSRIPVNAHVPMEPHTKLTVNSPGDTYEQEADRVAQRGMRMPDSQVQRACACGGGCPTCQAEQLSHQTHLLQERDAQGNGAGETVASPIIHEVLRSPGQPLDAKTRAFMEPRFGHDFSQVRLHTDAGAAASARAVGAKAFTIGRDVVFGEGRYEPDSLAGRRLIAHELAHTIQQRFAGSGGQTTMLDSAGTHERAAADAVRNIDAGQPLAPLGTTRGGVARQPTTAASKDDSDLEEVPAKDTMAGTLVSSIIIDLRSGRVGFVVPAPKGMILGTVSTDLKPGPYTVKPDPKNKKWVFKAKAGQRGVKPGQRFEVSLEGALPWTLAYPDELPVFVGFSTKRKGGGPGEDPADLVRIHDEMAALPDIPEDPTIDGFVDFEYVPSWVAKGDDGAYSTSVTLKYLGGGSEDFDLATVGEGEASEEDRKTAIAEGTQTASGRIRPKVLNRSTVPNLWDLKQRILWLQKLLQRAGEEEAFREQLKRFPEVFTTVTLGAYFGMAPIKSPFRSPGWSPLVRETVKAQGTLRKGMLEALKQGGTKDVTVEGVAFRISQVVQAGKELVVKYSHIVKISKDVPKGMGKQMHAAFEAAAIQAGKQSGAKSVRVIVEFVQNPAWKEYLSGIGYQWMSTAEGIGMTKVFPL